MPTPQLTRSRPSRICGGVFVALVAIMYALLPGVFTLHAVTAHADHHAVSSCDGADSDHLGEAHGSWSANEHHGGEPDTDGLHCDLCHLIGTLAHAGEIPLPALAVAIDVTSHDYAFTPVTFCLPADLQAAPAAPRAPPHV